MIELNIYTITENLTTDIQKAIDRLYLVDQLESQDEELINMNLPNNFI